MNQIWSGNECERTHTLTTTTTGSKCSQKEVNNQTDYQSHNALGPPKVPSLKALGLGQSQVQDTNSAIIKIKYNSLRPVNLIEMMQRHFQGSLFGCIEYVPYTALTIVLIIKTINVRLD